MARYEVPGPSLKLSAPVVTAIGALYAVIVETTLEECVSWASPIAGAKIAASTASRARILIGFLLFDKRLVADWPRTKGMSSIPSQRFFGGHSKAGTRHRLVRYFATSASWLPDHVVKHRDQGSRHARHHGSAVHRTDGSRADLPQGLLQPIKIDW